MSTFLLRNVSKVQPQPKPATTAILPGGPVLFIGLDVHADSIAISLAPSDGAEVRRQAAHLFSRRFPLRAAKRN